MKIMVDHDKTFLSSFRKMDDEAALRLLEEMFDFSDERGVLRALQILKKRSWSRSFHRAIARKILVAVHGESYRSALNALLSLMKPDVISEELYSASCNDERDRDFARYYFYGMVAEKHGAGHHSLDRWR